MNTKVKAKAPTKFVLCHDNRDRYGVPILDCGLRSGEVGFAPVEYASRSTGQALHRAGIAESKVKHGVFEL